MMTVLNEDKNMKKYDQLDFVEFLEFLCRIAIIAIHKGDSIEHKVDILMRIIYIKMHDLSKLNDEDHVWHGLAEND